MQQLRNSNPPFQSLQKRWQPTKLKMEKLTPRSRWRRDQRSHQNRNLRRQNRKQHGQPLRSCPRSLGLDVQDRSWQFRQLHMAYPIGHRRVPIQTCTVTQGLTAGETMVALGQVPSTGALLATWRGTDLLSGKLARNGTPEIAGTTSVMAQMAGHHCYQRSHCQNHDSKHLRETHP